MTNTLTVDRLEELLQIQKDFDENDHAHLNELWEKVFK